MEQTIAYPDGIYFFDVPQEAPEKDESDDETSMCTMSLYSLRGPDVVIWGESSLGVLPVRPI